METALYTIAEKLDSARAKSLRLALSYPRLNGIFRSRAQRILALFALSTVLSLTASLYFPLVVLLVGPILYGFPHLFTSLRYVNAELSPDRSRTGLHFFSAVFIAVSLWRLVIDLHLIAMPPIVHQAGLPEIVSLIVSGLGCALFYRKSLRQGITALFVLFPVLLLSWKAPQGTIGILLLAHNFVAFLYWVAGAQTREDRRVALLATAIFSVITLLILKGSFDFLYYLRLPGDGIAFGKLDFLQLGKMIFPWSNNGDLLFHATVAYAFGQAMHYFVWMKAIPDGHHYREVPTSFRLSIQLAMDEFGPTYFKAALLFVVLGIGVWALVSLPIARAAYFSVSAYHGYLELAGLGFVRLFKAI